jgi:hypothetical protein
MLVQGDAVIGKRSGPASRRFRSSIGSLRRSLAIELETKGCLALRKPLSRPKPRPMNEPRRHHFNPEFSLRPWADRSGMVCEIKKEHGKVEAQPKSPKATGFQRDLYRMVGVPDEHAQHVEKNFMSPLDNDAARALQKILSGDRADWTGDERTAWTTFLLSLLFRNPKNVTTIKDHIRRCWEEGMSALEADYAARRLPTDPETFDGYVTLTNPAAAEIGASNFLMETIANERVGPTILNMHWTRHDLKDSKFLLLTSDRPVVMPLGLGDERAYIALPVSPSILFVAAYDRGFCSFLARRKHTELVKLINKAVVCQARKFVWAADASQLEFVRRHIGTAPDRVIVTEEQKKQSLAAARGELTVEPAT